MEFNIQNFLKKISINNEDFNNKQKIITLLQEYITDISFEDVQINKGIISFKNISPLKKSHIKRNKREIIQKAQTKEIIIRDII